MGSERRLLAELAEQGITDEGEARALLEVIEELQSAGDTLSNAIFQWTEYGNRKQAYTDAKTTIARLGLIVEALSPDSKTKEEVEKEISFAEDLAYVYKVGAKYFHPQVMASWMSGNNSYLGARPIDVLRMHGRKEVLEALEAEVA